MDTKLYKKRLFSLGVLVTIFSIFSAVKYTIKNNIFLSLFSIKELKAQDIVVNDPEEIYQWLNRTSGARLRLENPIESEACNNQLRKFERGIYYIYRPRFSNVQGVKKIRQTNKRILNEHLPNPKPRVYTKELTFRESTNELKGFVTIEDFANTDSGVINVYGIKVFLRNDKYIEEWYPLNYYEVECEGFKKPTIGLTTYTYSYEDNGEIVLDVQETAYRLRNSESPDHIDHANFSKRLEIPGISSQYSFRGGS